MRYHLLPAITPSAMSAMFALVAILQLAFKKGCLDLCVPALYYKLRSALDRRRNINPPVISLEDCDGLRLLLPWVILDVHVIECLFRQIDNLRVAQRGVQALIKFYYRGEGVYWLIPLR